ncbi:amidohydrolase family protein [Roseiconus lacunae]|uniref:amidohydrolase family protein n=1 Tax=Roseiconus lacunae TaxID=2605694 RepID=UPI0011F0EB03|nr:amidohydrolase family protein [Roseiconus lacunae]
MASTKTTVGGQILRCRADRSCSLQPGVIELTDETITDIQFGSIPTTVDFGDENTLVTPGLIDTHLHLPQFDSIGALGMPLLDWLSQVIFPAEAKWNDLDYARKMIKRVIEQCVSVGTTGVCAYSTSSYQATIAALEMFSEAGIRGVIGQSLMDRGGPDELTIPTDRLIDEVQSALQLFPSDRRMATAVTPRFALSCTEKTMRSVAHLAKEFRATIQTHLAETRRECQVISDHFDGMEYTGVYETMGLVTERSVFGHGIYLDQTAIGRLRNANAVIAHCPTANSFLGSGVMNRHDHLSRQVRLSLGSDIGAGFERSMVRVGRAMIEAAIAKQFQSDAFDSTGSVDFSCVPKASEAWYQITAGNAEAMGWAEAGRIQVGHPADLVVIHPTIPWRDSGDALSTVMFAWDDRWIRQTILRGVVVDLSPI